jgi:outer membrane protein assembly factor BamB
MNDTPSQLPLAPLPPEQQPAAAAAAARQPATPSERRLRLWPGVVIVALLWLVSTLPGWLAPASMIQFYGMFIGPMVAALAFVVWWLFASRLRWRDRFLVLLACAVVGAATWPFGHSSLNIFGLVIFALPVVMTTWVVWLLITPSLRWPVRKSGLLIVFLLTWAYFPLIRWEGVSGNLSSSFSFRWTPTAEEKFLAERNTRKPEQMTVSTAAPALPVLLQPGDWPGFRGPNRDGRLTGVRITTDWQQHPPREIWRHRVGPGWSSFAVVGKRLYTQEQRGEDEVVVCYDADSGAELWAQQDQARFSEDLGGPGPRATPTFADGKIYALGAKGRLNCLDAAGGQVVWSRDIVADSGAKVPMWGFAASPLVCGGLVTVFAGAAPKSVLAYDAASGKPAWSSGNGEHSYCSTHRARLQGVEQILVMSDAGLTALDPASGQVLWQHDWQVNQGFWRAIQPTVVNDSDVLVGTSFGFGTRLVRVSHQGDKWTASQVWQTKAIQPYFNDLVVHRDHVYGFDASFLVCVSLAEPAKPKWKTRGYGNGQVLLLPDQDLLLVLSEKGDVALVEARPDSHKELARFKAFEGKTWNHPVVAHGKLFIRNGEEAACYQLANESRETAQAGGQ